MYTTSHTIKKIHKTQGWAGGSNINLYFKGDAPTYPYGKNPVEKPLIGKNPPYILGEKPLTSTAQPHTT